MTTTHELTTKETAKLRDLMQVDLDSAEGFQTAADAVQDPILRKAFLARAGQRRRFAEELRLFVRANGEKGPNGASLKGKVHQFWLELRGKLQKNDRHAVLAEVERGEDVIQDAYEGVLTEMPGSAVSEVLHRHMTAIKESHDQFRAQRDAAKS